MIYLKTHARDPKYSIYNVSGCSKRIAKSSNKNIQIIIKKTNFICATKDAFANRIASRYTI